MTTMEIIELDSTQLDDIIDNDKQANVSNLLMGIRNGKMPTTRSPLFKGIHPNEVMSNWLRILSGVPTVTKNLYDYEVSRLSKVGPQGGYPPLNERWADLTDYWTLGNVELEKPPYWDELVDDVRARLFMGITGLRPQSYQTVIDTSEAKDSLNSNSGCPSYSKRSDKDVQQRAIADAESGKWKLFPAILGSRAQRMSDRFIFMFAMACNLVELSFVNVILAAINSNGIYTFAAWKGFTPVVEALDRQRVLDKEQYLSLDYTKMDKHCNPMCTQFVIDVLKPIFQPRYRDLLVESLKHINMCDVMFAPGKIIRGLHGMLSGSGWTNCYESIVSFGIVLQTTKQLGLELSTDAISQLLGDDLILALEKYDQNASTVFMDVASQFGMVANPGKQRESTENFTYLQRFFDRNIKFNLNGKDVMAGSYPGVLALNTAMNPERVHDPGKWGEDMETLRWIMILENCNEHPAFHELIDYFITGDRLQLGLAKEGFLRKGIVETFKKAKSIKGFVATFNQEKANTGIDDFEVVKYLRSKLDKLGPIFA